MGTTTARSGGQHPETVLRSDARSLKLLLARLDQDQADLERARQLLQQGRELAPVAPREAFELVHRAALRGAGVLVARANRERRRALPLNVWTALERLGGEEARRAETLGPLVAERTRLDRDASALPDPELLAEHLEGTTAHLDRVAEKLLEGLPVPLAELSED
ncbi:SAV_6107 family HEPN domain-containing protein [Brachybacterium sp. sponge]|uniref:SAV_6107 family HEPN domain-containing protein n=1 Tax=Brachybacterium sp. sponge TaxID=1775432 RepID=UPI0007A37AB8|nr:SAV_6107 family HEPN domain-containing protein [Brachybacterium sp. sponge]